MQILLNFLSNAVKFTECNKVVTVRLILIDLQPLLDGCSLSGSKQQDLDCSGRNKYVKFSLVVEDSGVGIPPENLDNLFIDFGKLEAHAKMNPTGTGLGLSICKRIIDQMGCQVSV